MSKWDYFILGQGIAGSLLAYRLIKRGKKVLIIDRGLERSSSMLAAGIINPVTGRNFIKSWMYDELIQDALPLYRELEELFDLPLLSKRSVLRYIPDLKVQNDWAIKAVDPEYQHLIENLDIGGLEHQLNLSGNWIQLGGYQLNLPILMKEFRKWFKSRNQLWETELDYKNLSIDGDYVNYGKHRASFLICCDGTALTDNPFLKTSFMNPSKGEVLLIRIPECNMNKMVKRKAFLTPFTDHRLWFGSKDSWSYEDDQPSQDGFSWLQDAADQLIKVEYEIVGHLAALRPTIVDRRPVIGSVPGYPQILIFNGMGTKGTSLTPYWSRKMVEHLEDHHSLIPMIQLQRFF